MVSLPRVYGSFVLRRWTENIGRTFSGASLAIGTTQRLSLQLFMFEYPEGAELIAHRDYDETGYRSLFCVNVIWTVWRARKGGELQCENPRWQTRRLAVFDGARCLHWMEKIEEGKRISLVFQLAFLRYTEVENG